MRCVECVCSTSDIMDYEKPGICARLGHALQRKVSHYIYVYGGKIIGTASNIFLFYLKKNIVFKNLRSLNKMALKVTVQFIFFTKIQRVCIILKSCTHARC